MQCLRASSPWLSTIVMISSTVTLPNPAAAVTTAMRFRPAAAASGTQVSFIHSWSSRTMTLVLQVSVK
jgi:hypothetical protein